MEGTVLVIPMLRIQLSVEDTSGKSAVNLLQPGDFCGAAAEVKLLTMGRLAAMNDCGRVPRATFASSEGIRRYCIQHADSNDR